MIGTPAPALPRWLERHLPFQRSLVDVGDGLRMHVMESGTGIPVLMLHGNPSWGFLWRKVADELRDAPVRLIIPDLIGLGLSDKPRDASVHTLERHARWIGALLDHARCGPLVFVGQDWGGAIGLLALADRPSLLRGLVLLNTVVGPPRRGFRPTPFHRLAQLPVVSDVLFRGLSFAQVGMFLAQGDRRSIAPYTEEARAYRWVLRARATNVGPLAMARMVPDSHHHPSIDALQRSQAFVQAFHGPTAIVWGTRDPVLGRVVNHLERMLPHAKVTRTNAGHFLQEEVPVEIAAAIRSVAAAAFP